jgi:hypothetical protein
VEVHTLSANINQGSLHFPRIWENNNYTSIMLMGAVHTQYWTESVASDLSACVRGAASETREVPACASKDSLLKKRH